MASPQLVLGVEAADVDIVRAVGELVPLRLRALSRAPRVSSSAQPPLTPPHG